MAATIVLKRKPGKGHLTSFLEGTDDAVLSSLIRTASGAATLYNDGVTTGVTIGGTASTSATLFTGAAMTTMNMGTGMGTGDSINIGGAGSVTTFAGDIVVSGTTYSVDSEVVNIADNHLYLNKDYTTTVAQTGGLVVNYLPTATGDTSTTGGFATTSTVNTVGAATFTAGDFVQFSGAASVLNDGLYEVLTHAANVLTIDTTPVHSFAQTAFTVDTGDITAVITKVTVSVIQAGTDGIWETGSGSTNAMTFSDLTTGGPLTLQNVYDNGDGTIVTDATGNFAVSGTQGATFDMDLASSFNVTGNSLSLTTTTSGAIDVTSAGALNLDAAGILSINSSAAAINLGNDAVAQAINIGTGAAARTINIGTGAAAQAVTLGSLTTTSSLTLQSGATGDIIFDSNTMTTPLPFNGTTAGDLGNQDLSSNFTATTLMGALNELKEAGVAEADQVIGNFITTGLTLGHVVYMTTTADTVADADASAIGTAESYVGVVKTIGALGTGEVVTSGVYDPVFETGSTRPANGAPVYLSTTPGVVTGDIPIGLPNSGLIIYRIGFMKDQSTLAATVTAGQRGEITLDPGQFIEL